MMSSPGDQACRSASSISVVGTTSACAALIVRTMLRRTPRIGSSASSAAVARTGASRVRVGVGVGARRAGAGGGVGRGGGRRRRGADARAAGGRGGLDVGHASPRRRGRSARTRAEVHAELLRQRAHGRHRLARRRPRSRSRCARVGTLHRADHGAGIGGRGRFVGGRGFRRCVTFSAPVGASGASIVAAGSSIGGGACCRRRGRASGRCPALPRAAAGSRRVRSRPARRRW